MYAKKIEQARKDNPFLSYTNIIYDLVLDDIIWSRFEPGTLLRETILAEWCGVSRSPAKEALNRLYEDGFLKKSDLPGYEIMPFDITDYSDYCEFRLAIEPQAAFFAARTATEKEIKNLENLIAEYKKSVSENATLSTLHLLDFKFHQEIIRMSGNRYFSKIYDHYEKKDQYFRTVMCGDDINAHYILQKHIHIYKKIACHDEKGALEEMRAHLELNLRRGIDWLKRLREE